MQTWQWPSSPLMAQQAEELGLGLMPNWHDWVRAMGRSLCSPSRAQGLPRLQCGRAQRWEVGESGLLRVSAGRLWLTAWAPRRGASQDIVLCDGQALWVDVGQDWLIEALDAGVQLSWQTTRSPC